MKYAKFPSNLTESDITYMFFSGEIQAECECGHITNIDVDQDEYNCRQCGRVLGNPCLNEEEVNDTTRPIQ